MKKLITIVATIFFQNMIAQCPPNFVVTNQAELNSLGDYIDCEFFPGLIDISGEGIVSLGPLLQLTGIGILMVHDVPNLNSWEGVNALSYIGELQISGEVPFISNFTSVTQINNLIIQNTPITGIEGFVFLGSIGQLTINGNPNLQFITAFDFVTSIQSQDGLGQLAGGLMISGNPNLESITGFGILSTLHSLIISQNSSLTSINFFPVLSSVTNGLSITLNQNLTSIAGLSSLGYVGGGLQIFDNPNLSTLYGIHNVDLDYTDSLQLTAMPSLTTCAFPNICNYLQNNSVNSIGNNGQGCEDLNAFLNSCSALSNLNFYQDKNNVYPNPVKNILTVENFNGKNVTIHNQLGQKMSTNIELSYDKLKIDFSSFEVGIYFLSFENSNGFKTLKIIKD